MSALFTRAIIAQTQYFATTYHQFNTNFGYIQVGAQNTSWAHIYSDRPNFIFNKPVYSMNGFLSYNNNLNLEAASGHYVQIKPRSPYFGLIIREYNSNDFGNFEITSSGLGIGYNTNGAQLTIGGNGNVNVLNDKTNSTIGLSDGSGNVSGKPRLILHQRSDIPHAYIYFNQNLYFVSDGAKGKVPLVLQYDGSVGIGFSPGYASGVNHTNGYKLAVNGNIHAKAIDIDMYNWSDFVFESDYNLRTLSEVESFIKKNGHLPDMPSTEEVNANGINIGEIQSKLLQKIEELTLYLIEMKKNNEILKNRVLYLENQLKSN